MTNKKYADFEELSSEMVHALISGIHCMGGVGAFRAFDVSTHQSVENYQYYRDKLAGVKEFATVFDVNINPRSGILIACPILEKSVLLNLENGKAVDVIGCFDIECKEELKCDLLIVMNVFRCNVK